MISWKPFMVPGVIVAVICLVTLFLLKFLNVGSMQLFLDAKAFVVEYGLLGIFLATILAGTVVPLGSPVLVAVAALLGIPKIPLILTATTGFTIGMMINYGLAYYLGRPYITKKVAMEKLQEIMNLWDRWGWTLYTIFGLVPVLPVELLSLICGLLKTRLDVFLTLSFVPRLVLFTILVYLGEQAGIWIGIL